MSKTVQERNFILALHRRLYLLDGKDNLPANTRVELYRLVKNRWQDLDKEERDYLSSFITDDDRDRVDRVIKACEKREIEIITWFDENYPLSFISSPPPIIYIKGRISTPAVHPYVAIVGSRKATEYGKDMTARIVRGLVPYGATIVSGLAYGIDAAAHRSAVEESLPTVAILGCGINKMYPASHMALADKISANGAVISEFPWGTPPLRHNFPLRNRVISGLSRGVLIVEAEIKSGSLITARWAADQGKEVFAVPGNVGRAMSSGTNLLIREGAHLVEVGDDIAGVLNLQRSVDNDDFKKRAGDDGSNDEIKRYIVEFLHCGGENLDGLVEKTGLSVEELLPLITEVELMG